MESKIKRHDWGLTTKAKQAQFMATYKEPYSYGKKLKADLGSFIAAIPKMPGALWQTSKEALAEGGAGYDISKPFWKQPKPTWEQFKPMYLESLKKSALNLIPGYTPFETIAHMPYVSETKFGKAIPKTPISSLTNKLLLNSMIKGTGKWIYNPEAEGRHWAPKISEPTSRWQEWKERPFTSPLEDIVNVAIVAAPILKATGVTAKVGTAVKGTAPYKAFESKVLTPLKQRGKFLDIVSDMKRSEFQRVQELQQGKLMKALKGVPKEQQSELQALITRRAELIPGMKSAENLRKALAAYEKSATIETKSLIKRGLLTESQVEKAIWKEWVKETGMSIDDLRNLGIKEPIYYPHTFKKYPVYGYPKLRAKKPGYLKTKTGAPGWEEPIVSIPKHKIEYITQKTVGEALKKIEDSFAKPIGKEGILPGYTQWNPKQFNLQYYPAYGRAAETAGALRPMIAVKRFVPKMQIPKFLNDEIVRMIKPVTGLAKSFGAVWDTATNTWKVSVLALSPRWIFNNIMGNSMLNTLAGVVNPASYAEAAKRLYKGWRQTKTQGITFARAMRRQHIPEGAWEGLYRAEARAASPAKGGSWLVSSEAPVAGMWKKLGYKLSEVPKAMYKINSTVESFFRTAHYIDKVNFGLAPAKALASVNEFLFDYSRLSVMEKAFARRVLPFYSWQKNITRLVVSYPFKHPTGMAVLQKLQKVTEEAQKDEADKSFLPDWFRYYIETPLTSAGENLFLSTRGINPFADVGMLTGGMESYLSALNPLLKIPLERATGQSFYKEKPFTSPYRDIMGGEEKILPSWWRHILSNFPQYTMAENLIKPYAKYDTGEPILDKEGNPKYLKSRLLTVLKMFGINLSPYNIEDMTQQEVESLMRKQSITSKYAEKLRKFQQQ